MKLRNSILLALALFTASASIDLNDLFNYEAQVTPDYITNDNTPTDNPISNEVATLGRVLFYDKKMSLFDNIACASCHMQQFGFGDTARLSMGFNGEVTGRHSMRLSHARFADEARFFWDERAASLEEQSTEPLQDFIEMGFSGSNGQPDLDSLIHKLSKLDYYKALFSVAFGDTVITEERMQKSLAQFVRSIHSFDSKYDRGRAQVNIEQDDFPNFSAEENLGKELFLSPPPLGGAGCGGCHTPPEFDIDPNSRNNGVVTDAKNPSILDFSNTRSPSLRDVFNPSGNLNGPLMHNGDFDQMMDVINHYNSITIDQQNPNLDLRLEGPNRRGQQLNLSQAEKDALVAFLKTLTSDEIYTAEHLSDPFDTNGELDWTDINTSTFVSSEKDIQIYPNPVLNEIRIDVQKEYVNMKIFDASGKLLISRNNLDSSSRIDASSFPSGMLIIQLEHNGQVSIQKLLKR